VATPLLPAAYFAATSTAPWLLLRAARAAHLRQNAPVARLPERFGEATLQRPKGKLIWLHAASVGEVQSAAALAPYLAAHATLLVTTSTQTGAERAAQVLPEGCIHQFQPVDTARAVSSFLSHWQPDLALFVEGDLWPRMCRNLARRGTPAALLNARASKSRARFPRSYGYMLAPFRLITCQTEAVRAGLMALGLPGDRLKCLGDLKADLPATSISESALDAFQTAAKGRPVWAAVSTHPADEAHVLAAHRTLLTNTPDALLLWLPRHPARAEAIRAAADGLGLSQRSQGEAPTEKTQILLADTLGEAGAAFATASTVFLGGGFGREGGHNPYEPAKAGAFVLSGPRVNNFSAAYARLAVDGFTELVADTATLTEALGSRLSKPHQAPWQGSETNAAAATINALAAYLP